MAIGVYKPLITRTTRPLTMFDLRHILGRVVDL